mmetsp:Transcript_6468/g.17310  ORF Transcript_6468/g.17310 Transcript_6468/m.17310 type:complete len:82 (+) Transcript_6468:352-597(+)
MLSTEHAAGHACKRGGVLLVPVQINQLEMLTKNLGSGVPWNSQHSAQTKEERARMLMTKVRASNHIARVGHPPAAERLLTP